MLLQPWHQLDEVARTKPVVELVHENALPGVAAGARRSRQGEQIGAAGDPGGGAALDRGGADLLVAEPAEKFAKPGDFLLIDAVERLWGDVAPGDPGPAGRDHDIDGRVGDPCLQLRDDLILLVANDAARRNAVPGSSGEIREGITRAVLSRITGVGNRQQRDIDRQERTGFIKPRHKGRLAGWSA